MINLRELVSSHQLAAARLSAAWGTLAELEASVRTATAATISKHHTEADSVFHFASQRLQFLLRDARARIRASCKLLDDHSEMLDASRKLLMASSALCVTRLSVPLANAACRDLHAINDLINASYTFTISSQFIALNADIR